MRLGGVALVLCLSLLYAGSASASGVITELGGVLTWSANVTFDDTVTIRTPNGFGGPTTVVFTSAPTIAVDASALPECTGADTATVTCTTGGFGWTRVVANGGAGADTLNFSDQLTIHPTVPLTLDGGSGIDSLNGGLIADTLTGGPGNDFIVAEDGADVINGGDDNDTIDGGFGTDGIDGGNGDDVITAGTEQDNIGGGSGNDTIRYDEPTRTGGVTVNLSDPSPDGGATDAGEIAFDFEHVIGTNSADVITGTTGANQITANDGDDQLFGLTGADVLTAGNGNDRIVPGGGADDVDGGSDTDTGDYSASGQALTLSLNGAGDFDDNDEGGAANDRLVGLERLLGGSGNDTFTWTPGSGASAVTFEGNGGQDVLTGSTGDDTILGGSGGDVLTGADGRDSTSYADHPTGVSVTVDSGAGNDGSSFDDGPGGVRDTVSGIEVITGSPFADTLVGSGSADELYGAGGHDVLQGGAGADGLNGGDGTDTASYTERGASEPVAVTLDGAANDGAAGENDSVGGDVENATGGAGTDTLTGNDGANVLVGNDGNDVLTGLGAIDVFQAGAGADDLRAIDGLGEPVDCGDGVDTVSADPIDQLVSCETSAIARPVVDADRDGYPVGQDCNDNDPSRNPGANEVPGNAVDEDCKNGAAPFPSVGTSWSYRTVEYRGKSIRFISLLVKKIPSGATVVVTCKAPKRARKACAFKRLSRTVKRATGRLSYGSRFKRRRLPNGTVVAIKVTKPQHMGSVVRLTVRAGKLRASSRCLPPGATKTQRC